MAGYFSDELAVRVDHLAAAVADEMDVVVMAAGKLVAVAALCGFESSDNPLARKLCKCSVHCRLRRRDAALGNQ